MERVGMVYYEAAVRGMRESQLRAPFGARRRKASPHARLLLCMTLWAALVAVITREHVVSAAVVLGESMEPTLVDGDRCLLNRWCLHFRAPERGEIVVVDDGGPGGYAVKRIIGVPGDRVEFLSGRVHLNGHPLREDYLPRRTRTRAAGRSEYDLRPGEYFVLGDNRDGSLDSRYYGPVTRAFIKGVVAGQE